MNSESTMFPIADLQDIDVAFGPRNCMAIMPAMKDIPKEFHYGHGPFSKLVSAWFFTGVKNLQLTPKEGVDKAKAMRHIKAVLGSFEPKHEHKEAACAYLLSQWFTDPKWEVAK